MTYGENDPGMRRTPDDPGMRRTSSDPRMRRTSDNTGGYILLAVVAAAVILGALYWVGNRNSDTASSSGTAPASQTTGSGGAAKNSTTGTGGAAR